jgi:hypothetical protein
MLQRVADRLHMIIGKWNRRPLGGGPVWRRIKKYAARLPAPFPLRAVRVGDVMRSSIALPAIVGDVGSESQLLYYLRL